jgi:hypothetical protein
MPFLNIDWTFIFGEVNNNPDQPVVLQRAFRAVSEVGRPQTALRLVFLQPDRQRPEVFWFGAFVLSQGRRVIFYFPYEVTGFDFVDRWTKHPSGGYPLDHITLEVDRRSWHVTGADPKRHAGGPRTVPLTGGGCLWFGIASAGLERFPKLRRRNLVRFPAPESVGPAGFDPPDEEIARFIVDPRVDPTGGRGRRVTTPAAKFRLPLSLDLEVLAACFPLPGELTDRYAIVSWA